MKYLLLAFMILFSLHSNGQTKLKDTIPSMFISKGEYKLFNSTPIEMSAYLKNGSDTIEIFPGKQIKFIKIGDRVYKIESPRLTEVVKEDSVWWRQHGGVIRLFDDKDVKTLLSMPLPTKQNPAY